jgi:hypothetical protein
MLNVEGFHRKSRYYKGFRAFNIIPHILKAAVPTPTEEAPVQAFRLFHFSNCSPLNANASKKQPFLG